MSGPTDMLKYLIPPFLPRMPRYTHAIISGIPDYLQPTSTYYIESKKELEEYTRIIKSLVFNVIEIPEDQVDEITSNLESSILIIQDTAVLLKPSFLYSEYLKTLLTEKLNLKIITLNDTAIKLNGGDILFTGTEIFIGVHYSTNELGAQMIAEIFPDFPCIPIKITGKFCLKYYVTMAGPDTICFSKGKESQTIMKMIKELSEYPYELMVLDEEIASNVLYANGTLLHRSLDEIPKSDQEIYKHTIPCIGINFNRLGQLACGLSSYCLLFRSIRYR